MKARNALDGLVDALKGMAHPGVNPCCDLFGGGDGQEYAYDGDAGKWITVHPNGSEKGRKIHVDENGKVDSKGPLADAIREKTEEGHAGAVGGGGAKAYRDVDGNEIDMKVNEEARHSHQEASWADRPKFEDAEPIKELDTDRNHPTLGVMSGLNCFKDFLVPVDGHYAVVPGAIGIGKVCKGKDKDHVEIVRDERDLEWYGHYRDGKSTAGFNDTLKAVKKLSDAGMFMQSFKCDYLEDENGVGKLEFSPKDNPDDGEGVRFSLGGEEHRAIWMTDTKDHDYTGMLLDGSKKGETRNSKGLPVGEWVGLASNLNGKREIRGMVKFGDPIWITKDSPEYADAKIKGDVDFDIKDGGGKWYYPVVAKEEFDKPVTEMWRNSPRGTYARFPTTQHQAAETEAMVSMLNDFVPGIEVGEIGADEADGIGDESGKRWSLIIGERGAARLEDGIKRLENLSVARRELKGRKWTDLTHDEKMKILLATGWQVGADGKWRQRSVNIKDGFGKAKNAVSITELTDQKKACLAEIKDKQARMDEMWNAAEKKYRAKGEDPNGAAAWIPITKIAGNEYIKVRNEVDELWKQYAVIKRKVSRAEHSKNAAIRSYKVGDFIKGTEIETAYPELKDMPIRVRKLNGNLRGKYDPRDRSITLVPDQDHNAMLEALQHEIQHAIQSIEGFARGGSITDPEYHNLAGEVEARNAQRRTASDIKKLLEDTEDVSRDVQIVRNAVEEEVQRFSRLRSGAGVSHKTIRDGNGAIAGWYDRNTGEVKLVRGRATPSTVAHEIGWHAVFHWAEKNHPELHRKLVQYAKEAPKGIEQSVKEVYGTKLTPNELLDEIGAERFTREDISPLLKEAERRASEQFFDRVENEQDNLRRQFVGASTPHSELSKGEIDEIAAMDPKEAVRTLVQRMLEGRNLGGDAAPMKGSANDSACCDLFGGRYEQAEDGSWRLAERRN